MEAVGTYKPAFDPSIQAAAELLEQRDLVYQQFIEDGAQPMILKTSDRGAQNFAENPLLRTWREMQAQALKYFQELGLTSASLKKINESAIKGSSELSALDKALLDLGG
jgi:hypothetical protein